MFALPQAQYDPRSAKVTQSPMAGDDKPSAAQPALTKKKSWFSRPRATTTEADAPPRPPLPSSARQSDDTEGSTLCELAVTGTSQQNAVKKSKPVWPFPTRGPKLDSHRAALSSHVEKGIPRSDWSISATKTTAIDTQVARARSKSGASQPDVHYPGASTSSFGNISEVTAGSAPHTMTAGSPASSSTGRSRVEDVPRRPGMSVDTKSTSRQTSATQLSERNTTAGTSGSCTNLPPLHFGSGGRTRAESSPKQPDFSAELHSSRGNLRLTDSPSLASTLREAHLPATPSSLRTVSTPPAVDHVPADPEEDFAEFFKNQERQKSQTAKSPMIGDPRSPRNETSTYSPTHVQVPAPKVGRSVKTEKKIVYHKDGESYAQYTSTVDPDSPGLPSTTLADLDPLAWRKCVESARRQLQIDLEREHSLARGLLNDDGSNAPEGLRHRNLVKIGEELATRASRCGFELKDSSQPENSFKKIGKDVGQIHDGEDDTGEKMTGILAKFFRKAEKKDSSIPSVPGPPRNIPRKLSLQHLAEKLKLSPRPTGEVGVALPVEPLPEVNEEESEHVQPRLRDNFDGSSSFAASSIYDNEEELAGLGVTIEETRPSGGRATAYTGYHDDAAKAIPPPSHTPAWETEHYNPGPTESTPRAQTFNYHSGHGGHISNVSRHHDERVQDERAALEKTPRRGPKMERPISRRSIHSGDTEYVEADDWEDVPDDVAANEPATEPDSLLMQKAADTVMAARKRDSILVLQRGLSRTASTRRDIANRVLDFAEKRRAKHATDASAFAHPAARSQSGDAPTPTRSAHPHVRRLMDGESPAIPPKSALRLYTPPKYGGPIAHGERFSPDRDQKKTSDGTAKLDTAPLPMARPVTLARGADTTRSERASTATRVDPNSDQGPSSSESALEEQIDTLVDKWNEATPALPDFATLAGRRGSTGIPPSISGLQHLRHKLGLPLLKERGEGDRPHPNHPYAWDTVNVMCHGVHGPTRRASSPTGGSEGSPLARVRGHAPRTARSTTQSTSDCKERDCFHCGCTCCLFQEQLKWSNAGFARDPVMKQRIERAAQHVAMLREHSRYRYGIERYDTNLRCSSCARTFCPEHGRLCEHATCRAPICAECRVEEMNGGYCEEHFLLSPARKDSGD